MAPGTTMLTFGPINNNVNEQTLHYVHKYQFMIIYISGRGTNSGSHKAHISIIF